MRGVALGVGLSPSLQQQAWSDGGPPLPVDPVAPSVITAPTISPSSGPVGTAFTLAEGTYGGTTPITLTGTLMLGGVDVTAQMSGGVYTSTAEGALSWSVVASNAAGSTTNAASATVAAGGSPTYEVETGIHFIGASNISGDQDGTGVTIVTAIQDEPGLGHPERLVNNGISGSGMDDSRHTDTLTAAGLAGEAAVMQVAGGNDSSSTVAWRLAAMDDQIDALGSTDFIVTGGLVATTGYRSTGGKWQQNAQFFERLKETYPAQVAYIRTFQEYQRVFPNVDALGNTIADDSETLSRRRDGQSPLSLLADSSHANNFGYEIQAAWLYRPAMLALGSSYQFPYVPMGDTVYTTEASARVTGGTLDLNWYSPHGNSALSDTTVTVLSDNNMDTHFAVDVTSDKIQLRRLTDGYPEGQSICDVYLRVTKFDKHYDVLQKVFLGNPGAFGLVRHQEAIRYGYEPYTGTDGRKGSLFLTFVPDSANERLAITGAGSKGFRAYKTTTSRLLVGLYSATTGNEMFGGSASFSSVAGDAASSDAVWGLSISVDLDANGANEAQMDVALIRPDGTITREISTATVDSGETVAVGQMLESMFSFGAAPNRGNALLGVQWASRASFDNTVDANLEQFVDLITKVPNSAAGQLGASGNDTGAVTIGGSTLTPVIYYGYGNAADLAARVNFGTGTSGDAGQTWLHYLPGTLLDVPR